MKIIVIALSGIGDALMFTPALNLLKKNLPETQIDALVMFKGVKDIYERNENISQVLYYDFINEGIVKSFLYLTGLRKKYDVSINVYPSNRKEYNIFSFLIGAEKRAAVEYLRGNTNNLGFLNNILVKENDRMHNVEENIKLVEKIVNRKIEEKSALEFKLTEQDKSYAHDYLQRINILEDDIVIGFHPGCATFKNHIKRRWEPQKFSSLGIRLIKEHKAKIFIFGGPDEDELKELVARGIDSSNTFIIKAENLAQSAAVMKRCNLFITNDSSLMHIASALKLNVIAIIGPTNTNYIYPWQTNYKIVSLNLECSPCFFYSPKPLACSRKDVQFKCIRELDVDMVYNATKEYLLTSGSQV